MQQARLISYKRGLLWLSFIFTVLILITYYFIENDLDRQWASFFYTTEGEWLLKEAQPWKAFYEYGDLVTTLIYMVGGIGFLLMTYVKPKLYAWRRYILVVFLTAILGVGILVNAILKDYWGRPRPQEIHEFGGDWEYRDVHQLGVPGKGTSFPSGHVAIAFALVSSIFLYQKSRWLALTGTSVGLLYGGLMSVTRVGQGAHFPTDTLWAFGTVLLVATFLYYIVLCPPLYTHAPPEVKKNKPWLISILAVLIIASFFLLAHRPQYKDRGKKFKLSEEIESLYFKTNFEQENINLNYEERKDGRIRTIIQGYGSPLSRHNLTYKFTEKKKILFVEHQMNEEGYFVTKKIEIIIDLPKYFKGEVTFQKLQPNASDATPKDY